MISIHLTYSEISSVAIILWIMHIANVSFDQKWLSIHHNLMFIIWLSKRWTYTCINHNSNIPTLNSKLVISNNIWLDFVWQIIVRHFFRLQVIKHTIKTAIWLQSLSWLVYWQEFICCLWANSTVYENQISEIHVDLKVCRN